MSNITGTFLFIVRLESESKLKEQEDSSSKTTSELSKYWLYNTYCTNNIHFVHKTLC
jgi:hypothetical protein